MSNKERLEKWRALWQRLTAEADDEEYLDAAMMICDRCGGRTTADCAECPVKTGRPLDLGLMNDQIIAAAIADLKESSLCETCGHINKFYCGDSVFACVECPRDKECVCATCRFGSKWVWRGPRRTGGA